MCKSTTLKFMFCVQFVQVACVTAASDFFQACLRRGSCHGGKQLILEGLQVDWFLEILQMMAGISSCRMPSGWSGDRQVWGMTWDLYREASANPLLSAVVCSRTLSDSG